MNEKDTLLIRPNGFSVGITPQRTVFYRLDDFAQQAAGLKPDTLIAVEMSPADARQFALMLNNKADEAEAEQSQH